MRMAFFEKGQKFKIHDTMNALPKPSGSTKKEPLYRVPSALNGTEAATGLLGVEDIGTVNK